MAIDEKDRRQFARLPRQFRMEISAFTFPLSKMRPFDVTGVDIGEGGVAVRCPKEFGVGEQVQLKIYIPKLNRYHPGFFKVFEHDLGQYIVAVAKIAWSKSDPDQGDYMYGLEFVDVYEDDLKALHNLIRNGLEQG
ncbi:PilZ domain-containing protein [Desulfoplanes formicivorans]|uniref:Pilus assembly protein PilZ n=1 Tax=Desulfoplanes formicivorans TaxID=1592317 RepID=A0A194AI94_9BACT|nr:PilZ domain-containing protein [Desulfoplanes formicivorans]GAU09802.1 pilus assembly protein PilZ [Desulfoplanes formicivorans]